MSSSAPESLAATFGVELGEELASGIHQVFAAVDSDGRHCVLKLARPGTNWVQIEARALSLQDGRAAVRLLAEDPAGVLLERVEPGVPISRLLEGLVGEQSLAADDTATAAIAEVMAQWDRPLDGDPLLPPVSGLSADLVRARAACAGFGDVLRRDEVAEYLELADLAEALLRELEASSRGSVLLHGDLHHDNVLSDSERGYLAIDPHGRTGDKGFEVGQMLINPPGLVARLDDLQLAALTTRRLDLVSSLLGAERERLAAWGFVKAVIAQGWFFDDDSELGAAMRIARLLRP